MTLDNKKERKKKNDTITFLFKRYTGDRIDNRISDEDLFCLTYGNHCQILFIY